MKRKSFQEYLKTRLTDEEITEIEQKAQLEVDILKSIQKVLADINDTVYEKEVTKKV